jgi:hypothetical protein
MIRHSHACVKHAQPAPPAWRATIAHVLTTSAVHGLAAQLAPLQRILALVSALAMRKNKIALH